MTVSCSLQGSGRRPLLAKLVLLASTAVALATSAPPSWHASEERQVTVVLSDGNPRELQVTVELAGPLYADVGYAQLSVSAISNRAATDLTLTLRRLAPNPPASLPEGPAADSFFEPEPDAGLVPDAGVAPGASTLLSARPTLDAPDRVSLVSPLLCAESVSPERAESCREVFLLRLSRESAQATEVAVHAELGLVGGALKRPSGTIELVLEGVTP